MPLLDILSDILPQLTVFLFIIAGNFIGDIYSCGLRHLYKCSLEHMIHCVSTHNKIDTLIYYFRTRCMMV